jgi:hypothetical protein
MQNTCRFIGGWWRLQGNYKTRKKMDDLDIFFWVFGTGANLWAAYVEHKRGEKHGRNICLSVAGIAFILGLLQLFVL